MGLGFAWLSGLVRLSVVPDLHALEVVERGHVIAKALIARQRVAEKTLLPLAYSRLGTTATPPGPAAVASAMRCASAACTGRKM